MKEPTSSPQGRLRLSQLIYDTRYRGITIQIIALILVAVGAWWLFNNIVSNLALLGKTFSFSYLGQRANYDINQTLISYDSASTHGRAAVIGILNTLLVAALSCVLATVIGVLAGVLRLSKNWLVAKLMTVYVETFRNIPLLLWILLIFAVLSESTPAPRDFAQGTAAMLFGDSIAITNRGVFVPKPIWGEGAWVVILAFVLGFGALWALRRRSVAEQARSGRTPLPRWLIWLGAIAVGLVAYLVQSAVLGGPSITFEKPELGGFNFKGGFTIRSSLVALTLGLSLYTGAFIAEIVRGGILAVSKGQSEAAAALGLRQNRIMSLVVLPQAMRVIIPPIISQYLNVTKNSSLALAVGYMDVRATLGGISINQTGRELEGMFLLGLFYLVVSLMISAVGNWYNARKRLKER